MSLIERDKTLAVALDCAPGRLTARILDAKAGRIVGEVEYVPASDLQGAVGERDALRAAIKRSGFKLGEDDDGPKLFYANPSAATLRNHQRGQ